MMFLFKKKIIALWFTAAVNTEWRLQAFTISTIYFYNNQHAEQTQLDGSLRLFISMPFSHLSVIIN